MVAYSSQGVATYTVDYPAQKVIVTGNVNRDKVLKRILKTGKHAELEEPAVQVKKEEKLKQEVIKKANSPQREELYPAMAEVQTVILKVVLHCEGCARTVKRAVKRIPGMTAYDVDFPGQKVTVTGAIIPEDVYRHVSRTGKITVLVPPPPPPPPSPEEPAKVEEPPKEEPPKAEEPKAEEAKPEEPKKEEAAPAPAPEEKKEEPPKEEAKPEEPKKEEEAKKEEAAPAAEEKKEEEKKPEEAKPEEKKEEAAAPAAEEKKDESKEEAKPEPAPAPAPEPPPPPTMEELYPVTFVLGADYTRYYYY